MTPPTISPPMIPLSTTHAAHYEVKTSGDVTWTYELDALEGASGLRRGSLSVRGVDLPLDGAKPGARVRTPWGVMVRASDDAAGKAWLPEGEVSGYPVEAVIPVPDSALDREGTWEARTFDAMPWQYRERVSALGTRSEGRHATLSYSRLRVVGANPGDYIDTPWGRMRWLGAEGSGRYESGFLLLGTYDRSLEDMTGERIDPTAPGPSVRFESLYLDDGVGLDDGGRRYHGVTLVLESDLESHDTLGGQLVLDPNACSLNLFGDRAGCTKMGMTTLPVSIDRLRSADPTGGDRRIYQVRGERLVDGVHLTAHPNAGWCVLKVGDRLVPLFR